MEPRSRTLYYIHHAFIKYYMLLIEIINMNLSMIKMMDLNSDVIVSQKYKAHFPIIPSLTFWNMLRRNVNKGKLPLSSSNMNQRKNGLVLNS